MGTLIFDDLTILGGTVYDDLGSAASVPEVTAPAVAGGAPRRAKKQKRIHIQIGDRVHAFDSIDALMVYVRKRFVGKRIRVRNL